MPTRDQIRTVFDVDAAYRLYEKRLNAEEMLSYVNSLPAAGRKFILNLLGLGAARQMTRAAAAQVLARLAAGGARRDELIRALFTPTVWPYGADINAPDWAAFAGDDPVRALRLIAAETDLFALSATPIADDMPHIESIALVAAADAGLAGSAIALCFLAARDEFAATAYDQLRENYPALPPARPFTQCTVRARVEQSGHPWPEDGEYDLNALHTLVEDALAGAEKKAPGGELPEGLVEMLDEPANLDIAPILELLTTDWQHARTILAEQVEAMDDDKIPDAAALEWVAGFAALTARIGERLEASDRKELSVALAALLTANDIKPARAWLVRLSQMVGPADLTDEIEEVTELATAASKLDEHELDGALEALLRLIDLADVAANGGTPDIDELFNAQQVARTGLPKYGRLIYASSTGSVVVPKAPDDVDDDTAAVPDEADGEETDAPVLEPTLDVAASAHEIAELEETHETAQVEAATTGESTQEPEPATADTAAAQQEHAEPDVRVPEESAEAPESPQPDAAELDTDSDDVSLADLASLRETAAASLRRFADTTPPVDVEPTTDPQPTTTAMDAEPVKASVAAQTWGADAVAAADRQLIIAGRFGLAADLAAAAGASEASVAARRIAAYAQNVRTATGEMATAFSELAGRVVREDLRDDRVGQLVAWAAAAKMAILAPPAGPADTLINLTPCIESSSALVEVTDAFTEAARNGVVVVAPEAVRAAGVLAAAIARVRELSARATEILATAKSRNIKYIPANEVYLRWIAPEGALGYVLATVSDNDTSRSGEIGRIVVEDLRFKAERNIDAVFRTFANRSTKVITAGPRQQLLDRWDEAITLASQWAEACEQVSALEASARTESWQASALGRLRARIEAHRETALADLTAFEVIEGIDGDASASALLADAYAACDEGQPDGDEPSRGFAEHAELLALPLPIDTATLTIADDGDHLPDLLALAAAPELTPDEVYAHLAERAAHDLTEILVAGTRAIDPADGARLESQRNRDFPQVDLQVRDEVAALRSEIDVRRLEGALSDQVWSGVSARVAQLATPTRRDYERIREAIAAIRADLDDERVERILVTRERIESAVADNANVAEHQEHLLALCDAGQIATAEERLQQAIEGAELTSRESDPEHLRRFFPFVPEAMSHHADALDQLALHLRDQVDTPLTQELSDGGIDLFSLSRGRAEQAKLALAAWRRLASKAPVAGPPEQESLAHILRQAGLEFAGHTLEKGSARNRQWLTLHKVTGVGKALTPVLGSGMSPGESGSLRVLLVRQGTTPSTVIEWMSGEPGDRTVLALWLQPTALTAQEWRAIGEASRGRKHPPVIMFDLGTLLYLCAQAEPRRTTLASITLPFTSANPYRDTPGDAAPEMFYGRTEERAEIMDGRGSSFVSGGRQLGKTTLLQDAARRFAALSEHHVAVFLSAYTVGKINASGQIDPPEHVWNLLWPDLASRDIVPAAIPKTDIAAAVHHHVKAWLAQDERRQLLILLDEADDFLDADSQHARFVNVGWFRSLMLDTGRRAKVVLAGLHRTARFESLPNQPLSHLGRPIVVGPLRPQHAYDLITVPMAAMGYTFDSELTVARALATANNMPAQLQLLGASLVEHMSRKPLGPDGPPNVITADDVEEAFDHRLQALFREKFTLTLTLDPRYKVIAYVVAYAAHQHGVDVSLTLSELSDECRTWWPEGFADVPADEFRGLVNECVDLGVLAADGTRFRLRTPTVLRLLGTDIEVFEELADASTKLVVPTISDGGAFRPQMDDHHSSLTARQLGALLKPEAAVTVVAGSNATGLSRILPSLEHARDTDVPDLTVVRCSSTKDLPLSANIAKAAGRTWLLIDGRHMTTSEVERVLRIAQAATEQTRQPVRTIVTAGPGSAAAWATWPNRVDLARYEPQGLAMHADVNNMPFHEPAKVAQFLTATGGWPELVNRVTAALRDPNTRSDGQGLLDDLAEQLTSDPGTLATAVGLDPRSKSALGLVFAQVIAWTGKQGEPLEDLAELIDADADAALTAALKHAGFANVRDALAALVALGALVTDTDGAVSAEPVLRRDFELAAQ